MNKLRNFLDMREQARMMGDTKLQHAMDVEMARIGYCAPETTQAPEMEMAVPEKPRRGRPPRPRCEHDLLLERCEDCRDEGIVEEVA